MKLNEKPITMQDVIDLLEGIKDYRIGEEETELPFGTLDYYRIERCIEFLRGETNEKEK